MKKCYIFSFIHDIIISDQGEKKINTLVLFFPYKNIERDTEDVQLQLREYFYKNIPPDKITIICPEFNQVEVTKIFKKGSTIYSYIPHFEGDGFNDNISAISINKYGVFKTFIGTEVNIDHIDEIYNRGLIKIFNANGGLIISKSAHHFVFPSGKHCDRFLRTGNVLIHGSEILFIVSALIKKFKNKRFENIYCDTSSINSLAYSYITFLKELDNDYNACVRVESFGSYKLFEESKFTTERGSLFLISSSTSGSIIRRMTEDKRRNIELENIAIIYGLSVDDSFNGQVICDLTIDPIHNPDGLTEFKSYNPLKGKSCNLCKDASKPIEVQGDVFLLEKPNVVGQLISKLDAPSFLNKIGSFYEKSKDSKNAVLKCYFKDDGDEKKYDVYIDIAEILGEWENRNNNKALYSKVFEKLEKYVLQNIPASLKYMIVLSDEASTTLAEIISEILNQNGLPFNNNNIIKDYDLKKIDKKKKGTIAVISSSIVSGRNLLFLGRALRDFELTYQKMFFTFINRTQNPKHCEFLESNLGLGEFGKNTNRIISVEKIYCSDQAYKTSWHMELDYVKEIEQYCDSKEDEFPKTLKHCREREVILNESGLTNGLIDNLFFPSTVDDKPLKIRKGFAFAPNIKYFIARSTQSEIYFIISCIINELRIQGRLDQSEYVRNVLDPGNFIRYNDGIIQACLLRAATTEELRYDLTDEMGSQMKRVLGDMIIHYGDNHSEGLNEFFYAIAIKKLRLKENIIQECIDLLEDQKAYLHGDSILKGLIGFIKDKVLIPKNITEDFMKFSEKQIIVE
ncbi:hypothetical protein [Albibacterium bauzanense]|uniref:Uncharacterized protein n=1 Tax=Albibacterium bauzanense TaxID=653929 RepID=A0A4R1M387_9SPHI|nr:hypothetical protein [Albibacterium bauzanense]TCK85530.1 hypothetical protein C8N28_0839 [Albibacterium bauzanense]